MRISKLFKIILFIIFDLLVFAFCGIYMMGYDDFYNQSQGENFSFKTMTNEYKIVWGFYNLWIILNCVLFVYILFKLYEKLRFENR